MPEQITIEQMQLIIGRLTMNYEMQISHLQAHIQDLQKAMDNSDNAKTNPITPLKPVK